MREERWKAKMERSPFHVDLVAEQERIDEVCVCLCVCVCSFAVCVRSGLRARVTIVR
jgi:hypothetical protein